MNAKNDFRLKGVYPALVTPFTRAEELNEDIEHRLEQVAHIRQTTEPSALRARLPQGLP